AVVARAAALHSHTERISVTRLARSFATLAAAALTAACASPAVSPPPSPSGTGEALVAVFAHPDDETIVAPALSHAARNGATVYLVVATDGRRRVSQHGRRAPGDTV